MENKYKRIDYSNEKFRKNINYLITRENVTKNFLESSFQIGEGSLSRYCKDTKEQSELKEPKIGIINSIAKAFGVTIDDLINEDIEEKDLKILESSQRKDILFCNKLIEQTKENKCQWQRLDTENDPYINIEFYESDFGIHFESNFVDSNGKFKSKFLYEVNEINYLNGFTVKINVNENVEVFLTKHVMDISNQNSSDKENEINKDISYDSYDKNFLDSYELYFVKENEEAIPCCSSYRYRNDFSKVLGEDLIYDEVLDNILKKLYRVASEYVEFGRYNFQKELIFNEFLSEHYISESEMPF